MLTRSQRRAHSRDDARANPITPRPPSYGQVGAIVHAPRRIHTTHQSTASGQHRINAKRQARAEYWRTVKIRVSVELEPYFRQYLPTLGNGTRIQGRTPLITAWAVDLDVHIPDAPAAAVRAEPVSRSVWHGDHYEPELDYVVWYDAHGQVIDIEAAA
ncbi:hypothetical protein [Streptacidiphilus sp. EB129]|uniref:hypothetical protein n=1 Tax=Streptacidiphilus sp. EB129 TaxID=3156262 RepID=UPI0035182425